MLHSSIRSPSRHLAPAYIFLLSHSFFSLSSYLCPINKSSFLSSVFLFLSYSFVFFNPASIINMLPNFHILRILSTYHHQSPSHPATISPILQALYYTLSSPPPTTTRYPPSRPCTSSTTSRHASVRAGAEVGAGALGPVAGALVVVGA